MTRHIRALAVACAIVGMATAAAAQATTAPAVAPPAGVAGAVDDPSTTARFHFGVLRFTPALAISNVGVDNNVFNSGTDPKADTTAAVGPVVNLWLKTGRGRLSGQVGGQYLYYRTFDNQRAWNTSNLLRFEVPLGRMVPFVTGGYMNTKDRPGFEIDARVRQKQETWTAGTAMRLGGRTSLVLDGGQIYTIFDNQSYYAVDVAETLNRRTDTERAQFRDALTPLTTLVVTAETIQDRFDGDRSRNSDSVRATAGFELKPAALISGTALIGFRRLNILADGAPDYNGIAALATVNMAAGRYRASASETRDVGFSYEQSYPFYVLTSTSLQLTRRIGLRWDVVARGSLNRLAYRQYSTVSGPRPTDQFLQGGGGVGYTVARAVRVGLNVDYFTRQATSSASLGFQGLRAGLAFSYGIPQ